MNCRNCGKELEPDMLFCTACGTKVPEEDLRPETAPVPEKVPQEPVPEEVPQKPVSESVPADDWGAQPVSVIPEEKPKKKSRKLPLIIGGAVLVIAAVVLLVCLLGGSGGSSADPGRPTSIYAHVDEDGVAYIPLMNGSVIKIDDEVNTAVLTADRKHVVVLLEDGDLYITDTKLSKKNVIASDVTTLRVVRDDGFLYSDEDDLYYRVMFRDNKPLELGEGLALAVGANSLSMVYATDDGNVYTLPAGADEETRVSKYDDSIDLKAISDNGEIAVWVNKKSGENSIVLCDGEERTTLGKLRGKYTSTYVTFTLDQGLATVVSPYSDAMWIKKPGEEPIKVKLGADASSSSVFCDKGLLSEAKTSQVNYLYVGSDADDYMNVYAIDLKGEREKILSKVADFAVADGKVFYLDKDNDLYQADLKKGSPENEQKLSGNVDLFELSTGGGYLYFMKDVEDGSGTLYCQKVGAKESQKVSSDVGCLDFSFLRFMSIATSDDGKTVYFLKDVEEVDDTYRDMGTLTMWRYGDKSTTRLATDVLFNSFDSFRKNGTLDPSSFMFMKFSYTDGDDIYMNWMYWNGREAQKLATDVLD